ncbi:MAG TPA: bifunctional diaminohydroxyphosphoribosylaminopyrimidine deaminase/5-amino-6-(5-phosphoribosylamino)uracil reductase RibD [Puia sp.]|nr:bifunctional diaminohydroxyphosphoribosylaminopyrimidine deaminase/5-amino-6-(5-phosphoribosylamino)uracil reductase RibD [Puia sp.]
MQRCLELARLGAGYTAPNPMVGAVLVHEGRIIGEGYHELYGKAHAEVNCLASVREEDIPLISRSTIYVSLEPCAHYGKTPPCADLIIAKKIPRVVVGCRDPFPEVDGKGIEKLRAAGVEVVVGVQEKECKLLNKRFFTFHTRRRPYILLKWAQSANGKIGGATAGDAGAAGGGSRVLISNEYSNRLVHKWRSEEAAILVGTNTALADDPALTVRLWTGPDPIRLVIDRELRLPSSLRLFDGTVRTIVFNTVKQEQKGNLTYYRLRETGDRSESPIGDNRLIGKSSLVPQLVNALYELKILSVLVEGGAALLQSFIDEGYWDEARVITNNELEIADGLAAPVLKNASVLPAETLLSDTIRTYHNPLFL